MSPEALMVGPSSPTTPAQRLALEQARRRRKADAIAYLLRSRSGAPEALDRDDEEEIEVAVEGEWERADPSVGIASGGFVVYGAVRVDNGARIALTEDESERIALDEMESADDDEGDYREDDR